MTPNPSPQVFLFLSRIIGKKILDTNGRKCGRVLDLVIGVAELYPIVLGVLYRPARGKTPHRFPWDRVREVGNILRIEPLSEVGPAEAGLKEGELLLKEALLDKQIVDTHGAKILRVNDLHLLRVTSSLRLVHVDVGLRGLMRRVGLERATEKFFQWFFDYQLTDNLIPWRVVQPLSSPDILRLKVSQNRLARLHPADLADIIEDLDINKRTEVFQALDVETAAEALEETDPKIQVHLIENLHPAKASDIIEEMSPSEAADLLGDLPKEKAEGILKEMEQEMADDVKELLVHPEEEAGGLMTTSFPVFPPRTTVKEALDFLRREAENLDMIYYLYVADDEGHLLGVASLRDLLMAKAEAALGDLMEPRIVSVGVEEEKDEIADLFAKYAFKAIPVVDEKRHLRGVIPFRNLLEVVAPQLGK